MLRINEISVFYGQLQIIFDLSLSIKEGEIVSLIGPNGAGKTTTLRTISGILVPQKGSIEFLNRRIDGAAPYIIASSGIAHIPEGREVFPSLRAEDNLEMGAITQEARDKKNGTLEWIFSLFPILKDRKDQLAGTLSGGEQQMLAIGRGLMALPKLMVVDEVSLGLAPLVVNAIFGTFEEINSKGATIFIVEQNVLKTLSISDRAYVLESGHLVMEGTGAELLKNPHIKNTYLGI